MVYLNNQPGLLTGLVWKKLREVGTCGGVCVGRWQLLEHESYHKFYALFLCNFQSPLWASAQSFHTLGHVSGPEF